MPMLIAYVIIVRTVLLPFHPMEVNATNWWTIQLKLDKTKKMLPFSHVYSRKESSKNWFCFGFSSSPWHEWLWKNPFPINLLLCQSLCTQFDWMQLFLIQRIIFSECFYTGKIIKMALIKYFVLKAVILVSAWMASIWIRLFRISELCQFLGKTR